MDDLSNSKSYNDNLVEGTITAGNEYSRLRSVGVNGLIFLVSVSLLILGAELGLRLLDIYPPVPWIYVGEQPNRSSDNFIPDPNVGWKMKPQHRFQQRYDGREISYFSDNQGFRVDSIRHHSEAPSKHIVILGDSFMWGSNMPYQDTVSNQVESSGENYVIHNLAMPGFAVDQIWLSLRHWGLQLKPDLVIVGLYTGDFNRSFYAYRPEVGINKPTFRLKGKSLVKMVRQDRPGKVASFLNHNSRLLTVLRRADRLFGLKFSFGKWWSLNQAFLDAMREDARISDVPILFIHIPPKNTHTFVSLEAYMRKHEAHYFDLGSVLEEERQRLYLEHDLHLNREGHLFLSEMIVSWMENH